SRYIGYAFTSWILSSPVKTQLNSTPPSSITQGSTAGTTSGRDCPHRTVRACSFSTALAHGPSGSGGATLGNDGARYSTMTSAIASADAAGASHAGGPPPRGGARGGTRGRGRGRTGGGPRAAPPRPARPADS